MNLFNFNTYPTSISISQPWLFLNIVVADTNIQKNCNKGCLWSSCLGCVVKTHFILGVELRANLNSKTLFQQNHLISSNLVQGLGSNTHSSHVTFKWPNFGTKPSDRFGKNWDDLSLSPNSQPRYLYRWPMWNKLFSLHFLLKNIGT